MNYIKLLNAAFQKFHSDDRLNPSHISLYMALFQEWNSCRFANEFYVSRHEIMRLAKLGSKSTYHRCVTDLDAWSYLWYFPSNNPFKGSKIKMSVLDTNSGTDMGHYDPKLELLAEHYSPKNEPRLGHQCPTTGQVVDPHRPISGQALVSNINNNKQVNINKQPKGRQAVFLFFEKNGFEIDEAKKFFNHYEAKHWKTSDGEPIRDWHGLAINWMDRTELLAEKNETNKKQASQIEDNLRTTKHKNYGQPL
jgi:hypothetical protein